MPKRALFSVPFELAEGFMIGVKGRVEYLLITWARQLINDT